MTFSSPFAADQPAHPLDYWISPELARISPPNAPSRLRQLADAQGALAAAWSSAIGCGPVLALGGGFVSLPGIASRGTTTLVTVIGAYLLIVILLVTCIFVPSVVLGRARQSFRRRVRANPVLRTAVEDDLATWRDPYGTASYGPL
ncbi:hypothetical protein [Arthrobacter sp. Y81]|uniref:hypothetical protein n=1 Tax=Arthrobacter sp. Y81 TaxID=2058897 RepID=UPI000CE4ADD2|nr:hypothetical protein [Arthrobacter sp. Y81]